MLQKLAGMGIRIDASILRCRANRSRENLCFENIRKAALCGALQERTASYFAAHASLSNLRLYSLRVDPVAE